MTDALKLPEPKLWTLGEAADGKVLTGIKPTAGGGVPIFTAGQVADAILAERERCARVVPTSWLDSLMVMKVPAGCPEIEALCRRIAEAIRADGVDVPAPARWCPECRSAGVVGIEQDVCPTCDGTGKVAAIGVAPTRGDNDGL
jgi:hypothetical protein